MKQIFSAMLALAITFAAVPTLKISDGQITFSGVDYVADSGAIIEGVPAAGSIVVPESRGAPITLSMEPNPRVAFVASMALDPMLPTRTLTPLLIAQVDPAPQPTIEELTAQLKTSWQTYEANALQLEASRAALLDASAKLGPILQRQQQTMADIAEVLPKTLEIIARHGIE